MKAATLRLTGYSESSGGYLHKGMGAVNPYRLPLANIQWWSLYVHYSTWITTENEEMQEEAEAMVEHGTYIIPLLENLTLHK